MNTLIGISVRGQTYYFLNTFTDKQLHALKQFANNYQLLNPTFFEKEDHYIIEQFIHDASILSECSLHMVCIKEIFVIK